MPRSFRRNRRCRLRPATAGGSQEHLGLAPADLWRVLGYANSSTVQSVSKGETLPDFVRIAEHQADMREARGRSLNLHWVITGQGNPVLVPGRTGRIRRASAQESVENDIIVTLLPH